MAGQISRGAPAKFAHHGLIEKVVKETNHVSCSKCINYDESTKYCKFSHIFLPSVGYDYWKYCSNLDLIESAYTASNLEYIMKVKKRVRKKAGTLKVQKVSSGGKLKLKNLLSGTIVEYELHTEKKGPNILHPSDGLVIKAKQAKESNKKSFHWKGKTYGLV